MPSEVKVHVIGARNLPSLGSRSGTANTFVSLRFGTYVEGSSIVSRSSECDFDWRTRIKVDDDALLSSTALVVSLADKSLMNTDDEIGNVVLSLEPLLGQPSGSRVAIAGWFPLHDTLRGLRGEVNVEVRLEHSVAGDLTSFSEMREEEVQFFSVSRLSYR
jgi:hypothetical protein